MSRWIYLSIAAISIAVLIWQADESNKKFQYIQNEAIALDTIFIIDTVVLDSGTYARTRGLLKWSKEDKDLEFNLNMSLFLFMPIALLVAIACIIIFRRISKGENKEKRDIGYDI